MKKLILITLLSFLIMGCTTQKKVDKWLNNHREYMALKCNAEFPVKTEYVKGKTDTVTQTVKDTVIKRIECPPDKEGNVKVIECPPNEYIYKYIHTTDTLIRENTAQTYLANKRADNAERKAEEEGERADKEKKWKNIYLKGFIISIALLGILAFIFFRRR